jgi:hypothetical protein
MSWESDFVAALAAGMEKVPQDGRLRAITCGRVPIEPIGSGIFQITDAGAAGDVLPVADRNGEITDAVAWLVGRPNVWWRARGAEIWLGLDYLYTAIFRHPEYINLYATPLDWATAGGRGLCMLAWDEFDFEPMTGFQTVRVPSDALGEHLAAAIRARLKPPFRIVPPSAQQTPLVAQRAEAGRTRGRGARPVRIGA